MGGMEACIDVRREIRVLAWVAGAGVLLAVMFQFYPHGPQLGTDPFNLGYLFGRWMCAVEAVALVRQVGHMDRLAKKLSGLDGYLLTEQLRAVERVRRDGAICLPAGSGIRALSAGVPGDRVPGLPQSEIPCRLSAQPGVLSLL